MASSLNFHPSYPATSFSGSTLRAARSAEALEQLGRLLDSPELSARSRPRSSSRSRNDGGLEETARRNVRDLFPTRPFASPRPPDEQQRGRDWPGQASDMQAAHDYPELSRTDRPFWSEAGYSIARTSATAMMTSRLDYRDYLHVGILWPDKPWLGCGSDGNPGGQRIPIT